MIDDRTPHLNLPLPNVNNLMKSDDVPRLRAAIASLDQAVHDRATAADVTAAINALVNGAGSALNTLKELADAMGNDANFAATITGQLASKLSAVPVASSIVLGGVKVGAGLVVDGAGVLSTTGAGSGSGLPSYAESTLTATTNGQVLFTPSGGYVPGQVDLYLNGSRLIGGGDDYTASNSTTITLTTGINNTTDKLTLVKWYYIPIEMAVNKTGDTMTGHLNVPAAAAGTQVPRAQEVVKKAGDTMTGLLLLSADPAANLGAATKQYTDTKLSKAGGTMTGAIVLAGDPTIDLHAASKKYVDEHGASVAVLHAAILSF